MGKIAKESLKEFLLIRRSKYSAMLSKNTPTDCFILPTGLYVPSTVVQLVEHLGFEPGVLGAEPHGVFHVDNAA